MKNLSSIRPLINRFQLYASNASLGALLVLAYSPFQQGWLALVIIGLAFYEISKQTTYQAARSAFYFGMGYYGLGISWVFVSVSTFVSPAPLAALISLSLVVLMSLFLCLSVWFIQCLKLTPEQRLLWAYPIGLVLYEWLITYHLAQFPWLMLGNTMIDLPLAEYAPLFGGMGVGYLLFLSIGLMVTRRFRFVCLGLLVWLISLGISSFPLIEPEPDRYTVSAIQGNIPFSLKWDPALTNSNIQTMVNLTRASWDSDWVIWSENALPAFHSSAQDFLHRLDQEAKLSDTALIVGLPIDEGEAYYNSALVLGAGTGRYNKYHLVPFGEYFPLQDLTRPLLEQLKIPVSDFTPGRERQTLLMLKGQPVAVFSCFETIFFEHMRRQLQSAKAIIIISDDGWFGHSFAAYQQAEVSRMRAKELGRPLISVGNTGITALINPDGTIQQALIPHERNVLTTRLNLVHGQTPFAHYGNLMWLLLMAATSLLLRQLNKMRPTKIKFFRLICERIKLPAFFTSW